MKKHSKTSVLSFAPKNVFHFWAEQSTQKRIVLDPGHGGKDFAAIGINDLKEKERYSKYTEGSILW